MVNSLQTTCTSSSALTALHVSTSCCEETCASVQATPISRKPFPGRLGFHARESLRVRPDDVRLKQTQVRGRRDRRYPLSVTVTASSLSEAGGGDVGGDEAAEQTEKPPPGFLEKVKSFFAKFNAAEVRAKVAKLGPAAVLSYGLFDGITYTTFFVITFLGYEARTGQNPTANLKNLLAILVVMWGGNNVTRPLRLAGAAVLAPYIARGLKKLQEVLRLPSLAFAFLLATATFASLCLSVVGLLILSRLGR